MLYRQAILEKTILFDGAMGTEIQKRNLNAQDYGGEHLNGANDHLVLTRPDIIADIHRSYLAAGADVIETNSFGSNRIKLEEYDLGDQVREHNLAAASIARKVADEFSTSDWPRYVFGSIGPCGMLPSSTDPELSKIGYDELEAMYLEQALYLIEGGVNGLLIETSQDILEVKAVINGCALAIEKAVEKNFIQNKEEIAVQAQVTLDTNGKMLLGTDIASALATLETMSVDSIGLNCSTGPLEMREAVRYLCENSSKPVSAIPNAGMPENHDGTAVYPMQAEEMSNHIYDFIQDFGLNITGGCCGTTPEHIARMRKAIDKSNVERKSTKPSPRKFTPLPMVSSGMSAVSLLQPNPPTMLGERLNSQGSRKMKELLLANNFDAMVNLARAQEEGGAHVLDICLAVNERDDEDQTMQHVSKLLSNAVAAPLMIDSTEPAVIEAALKKIPGRPIVNSINLEGDAQKIHKVLPLVKKFGAAVVALTIDEKGMADTVEWKLQAAKRIYKIASEQYGLRAQDILFDCLTFTLATGEEKYNLSAVQTLQGIAAIKKEIPGALTTLGLSNVSFGFTPAARKILNSVFLYHAVKHGLDSAIVNPKDILPYAQIDANEKQLAEDLIFYKDPQSLQKMIAYFEDKKPQKFADKKKDDLLKMPERERVHFQIVHRIPDDIEKTLDVILKEENAVSVINNVLLPAMKEVGDKFGSGELILPFVLQSAEVMKRAVSFVEKFLEADESASKGTLVLATVYGDVHDIGKNLVKTIWSNNGFNVVDLGKQVPVNTILEQARKHNAMAIGLSALLVSTSKQMDICIAEMEKQRLEIPVIVGGAAVNRKYSYKISFHKDYFNSGVFYARDAFEGLDIVNTLADKDGKEKFQKEIRQKAFAFFEEQEKQKQKKQEGSPTQIILSSVPENKIHAPPFLGRKVLRSISFQEVFNLVDQTYLFRFKWGVRTKGEEFKKQVQETWLPRLLSLAEECEKNSWLSLDLVYGYFPAVAVRSKNEIRVFDPNDTDKVLESFIFPRQEEGEHLCLADYISFTDFSSDYLAMSAVTAGQSAASAVVALQEQGELEKSFLFAGLSTQMAEALAEYIHRYVRREWKLEEEQGLRYSFGYPACPNLSDQEKLYRLLRPEEIDLGLTESYQMDPEQSTSALIFSHPQCSYFKV